MIAEHPFWWLLTMACVVWYCTITVYVAIRGVSDIRELLGRLRGDPDHSADTAKPSPARHADEAGRPKGGP